MGANNICELDIERNTSPFYEVKILRVKILESKNIVKQLDFDVTLFI